MIHLLSAFALAVCGVFLIIRYDYKKKLLDMPLILAIWVLLLAGINIAEFFQR